MQWVVEDCLYLNANQLAKNGWFRDGLQLGSLKWKTGANISLQYRGALKELDLQYNLDGESHRQTIRISKTPCNFGGYRYYFHCPGCGARRYKLHLAHSGFYCRQCYSLPYYSQLCGGIEGITHRIHKIESKLDNLPKHARDKTVDRLVSQLEVAEKQWSVAMVSRFGAMRHRMVF
jgi:hypothetical protein